jgi:Domain of unknown function (DUF5642)
MPIARVLLGVVCAAGLLLVGCSDSAKNRRIDISKVFAVRSSFGPQFNVVTSGPTGIDPRLLAPPKFAGDMTFDPADCAKYAAGQTLPPGLTGKMAELSAEGDNNRFVVIAVETSQPVPYEAVSDHCKHIAFTGRSVKGVIDVIGAPRIDAARTLGTHRVLGATVAGQARSSELYNYTAYLGNHLVLVAAIPVLIANQPAAPVNVDRARRLLTDSVAAVRG